MHTALTLLTSIVLFFTLLQILLTIGFLVFLRRDHQIFKKELKSSQQWPKAAVILSLRGADPFINHCISNILQQDYPDYELWIVLDNRQDPAWEIVEVATKNTEKQTAKKVHITELTQRLSSCSLKNSAIVQVANQLDPSVEVVGLLDADTIAHDTWLKELASPLRDPAVGVTTGNRWYRPMDNNLGSHVRYLWNAAAIVQMYWLGYGWGGTIGWRTDFMNQTNLTDLIGTSFNEDTVICQTAIDNKRKVKFVPSLVMLNKETCTLDGFQRFLQRQLLCIRIGRKNWPIPLGHGILTTVCLYTLFALSLAAYFVGNWQLATIGLFGCLAFFGSEILLLVFLENGIQKILSSKGESAEQNWKPVSIKTPWHVIATRWTFFQGLLDAALVRKHQWRGIIYRFFSKNPSTGKFQKVYVENDHPYRPEQNQTKQNHSI